MTKIKHLKKNSKTSEHNVFHKGFLLFQIFIPMIIIIMGTCLSFFSPVFASIFFTGCCIVFYIIQLCLATHYYGWKIFLFSLLSSCLWILIAWFISDLLSYNIQRVAHTNYHCPPDYFCDPPSIFAAKLKKIRLFSLFSYFGLFWAPIIPQYWRLNHGRK